MRARAPASAGVKSVADLAAPSAAASTLQPCPAAAARGLHACAARLPAAAADPLPPFLKHASPRQFPAGEWGAATAGAKEFWRFDVRNNVRLRGCLPGGMERFIHNAAPFASVFFGGTLVNRTCT